MPGTRSTRVADRLLKYRVDAAGRAGETQARQAEEAGLGSAGGCHSRLLWKQTDRLGFRVMEVDEGPPFPETPKHDTGGR